MRNERPLVEEGGDFGSWEKEMFVCRIGGYGAAERLLIGCFWDTETHGAREVWARRSLIWMMEAARHRPCEWVCVSRESGTRTEEAMASRILGRRAVRVMALLG